MGDVKLNHKQYPTFHEPGAVAIMKQLEMMHETQQEILEELKKLNQAPVDKGILAKLKGGRK